MGTNLSLPQNSIQSFFDKYKVKKEEAKNDTNNNKNDNEDKKLIIDENNEAKSQGGDEKDIERVINQGDDEKSINKNMRINTDMETEDVKINANNKECTLEYIDDLLATLEEKDKIESITDKEEELFNYHISIIYNYLVKFMNYNKPIIKSQYKFWRTAQSFIDEIKSIHFYGSNTSKINYSNLDRNDTYYIVELMDNTFLFLTWTTTDDLMIDEGAIAYSSGKDMINLIESLPPSKRNLMRISCTSCRDVVNKEHEAEYRMLQLHMRNKGVCKNLQSNKEINCENIGGENRDKVESDININLGAEGNVESDVN